MRTRTASPPYSDRATVGGIVARGAEGPTLHRFGPVRDQILGIRVVHGDGRATRAGGRVVKNVTGYDLSKLMCGSFGTLAVLTEVCLKVLPRGEAERTVAIRPSAPTRGIKDSALNLAASRYSAVPSAC